MLAYVSSGRLYVASAGVVADYYVPAGQPIGSGDILTDGVWAWPDDLPYYIRHYHVALPEDFVSQMRANHWHVPELGPGELSALSLEP